MTEHQQADDPRPEFQLLQQTGLFQHSAPAAFPSAKHVDGKRMGITSSLALPDPGASSRGCSVSPAQLSGPALCCRVLAAPWGNSRGVCAHSLAGIALPDNTAENVTLITPTTRVVLAEGASVDPFPGFCCLQGVMCPAALCATSEPLHPGVTGDAASPGVSHRLPPKSDSFNRKNPLSQFSVGTSHRELMEQGTSPTYSTVTAVPQPPWGRVLSHSELKLSKKTVGARTSWGITRKTAAWPRSAEQVSILLLHH